MGKSCQACGADWGGNAPACTTCGSPLWVERTGEALASPAEPPSAPVGWGCLALLGLLLLVVALTVPEDLHKRFGNVRQCDAWLCWRGDTAATTTTYEVFRRGSRVGNKTVTTHACPAHAHEGGENGLVTSFVGYVYIALLLVFIGLVLFAMSKFGAGEPGVAGTATWHPPLKSLPGLLVIWLIGGALLWQARSEFGRIPAFEKGVHLSAWMPLVFGCLTGLVALLATLGIRAAYFVFMVALLTIGSLLSFTMDDELPWYAGLSIVVVSGLALFASLKPYIAWADARVEARGRREAGVIEARLEVLKRGRSGPPRPPEP